MEVIIHRSTRQIGGCVTEVKSNSGTRIVIDIGENLEAIDKKELPKLKVEGLNEGKPDVDAVFITHYHGDHIGLHNKILPEIPIYIRRESKEIYKLLQIHLLKASMIKEEDLALVENFKTYQIQNKMQIKDIKVTPIEAYNSAFNAHMLLVECDGKKLLHTGDFRIHGQKAKEIVPAIEKYVGEVDCLICEGITLSRRNEETMTETQIRYEVEKIFKENKNVFVMCSSTNIDRISTIHKAAIRAEKTFICDNYQKEILTYITSIARKEPYRFYKNVYGYAHNLLHNMTTRGFVMLVRDNELSKIIMDKFPKSTFIYSDWKGYLNKQKKEYASIQEFVPEDYIYMHSSGHATPKAIKKVCEMTKPKILIPIHCENPKAFLKIRT